MGSKRELKEWLDKRYEVVCPSCGSDLQASRSLAHRLGIKDGGYGRCIKCSEGMTLHYDSDTDSLKAKPFISTSHVR